MEVTSTQRDVKSVLDRVMTWSEEDQEELAEVAREIEARHTGVYQLIPMRGRRSSVVSRRCASARSDVAVIAGGPLSRPRQSSFQTMSRQAAR